MSARVSCQAAHEGLQQTPCHILGYLSKVQRHVTRSTFSSELFAATDATDSGLLQTAALHELRCGVLSATDAKKLIGGDLECSTSLGLGVVPAATSLRKSVSQHRSCVYPVEVLQAALLQ